MTGGQKLDGFVHQHFSKIGEKNHRTNRWKMNCNYYRKPDAVVEHREPRCTESLSKHELYHNVPESVWNEALTRLATKRGVLSSVPPTSLEQHQILMLLRVMTVESQSRRKGWDMALWRSESGGLWTRPWIVGSQMRKRLEST